MALSIVTRERRFIFQNSNGISYLVRIDVDSGAGKARKLSGSSSAGSGPKINVSESSFTTDAGKIAILRTAHISQLCHGAYYNTTTRLDSILNAAS